MNPNSVNFGRLKDRVLQELHEGPDEVRIAAQRNAFVSHVVSVSNTKAPRRVWFWAASVSMAVMVMAILVIQVAQPKPQEFWVADRVEAGKVGEWINARPLNQTPLVFSGGTRFELAPNSVVQVAKADRKEVRLKLKKGKLNANVRKHGKALWVVAAGNYRVVVTGTRFSVDWTDLENHLEVEVFEGQVRVESNDRNDPVFLSTGDRLKTDQKSERWEVTPLKSPVGPTENLRILPSPDTESLPESESPRDVPSPAPASTRRSPENWRALASRGEYARAVDAFDHSNDSKSLKSLDTVGLRTLADAARYSKNAGLAQRALLMIRKNQPRSQDAKEAGFLLGRIAADLNQDYPGAARWFSTYLREAPMGPLAEEALGRKVDSLGKAGSQAEAALAAREYLAKYPQGVFAALARTFVAN